VQAGFSGSLAVAPRQSLRVPPPRNRLAVGVDRGNDLVAHDGAAVALDDFGEHT
jgi:hypothetical protein